MSIVADIEDYVGDIFLPFRMLSRMRANAFLALEPQFERYADGAESFLSALKESTSREDLKSQHLARLRKDYDKAAAQLSATCADPASQSEKITRSAYAVFTAAGEYGRRLQADLLKAASECMERNNSEQACLLENYMASTTTRLQHWRDAVVRPHSLWTFINPQL